MRLFWKDHGWFLLLNLNLLVVLLLLLVVRRRRGRTIIVVGWMVVVVVVLSWGMGVAIGLVRIVVGTIGVVGSRRWGTFVRYLVHIWHVFTG